MYVESVSMTDFRCFAKAETTFVHPGTAGLPADALKNVTLLIGVNGAGKTSLLKGVALGVLAPIVWMVGYHPYYLVRRVGRGSAPAWARIVAKLSLDQVEGLLEQPPLTIATHLLTIDSRANRDVFSLSTAKQKISEALDTDESDAMFFCLGYGASRRSDDLGNLNTERLRKRHRRFLRIEGLFDEFVRLYPLAAWYPTLKSKARASHVRELLNSLLPERTQFTGECKDGDGLFENDGVVLPFGALSDGFRSYIGLVADMLYHMHTVTPKGKLTDLAGVVMIDDIDVHLHPAWQREVVPKLAATFPKLQFIVTTHSPLVVGTVHAKNIRVVEENEIREFTEETDGKSADQILVSSYFGLKSPRSPATERKLKRIAKRAADTHDPKAAVDFLKELTGKTTD